MVRTLTISTNQHESHADISEFNGVLRKKCDENIANVGFKNYNNKSCSSGYFKKYAWQLQIY